MTEYADFDAVAKLLAVVCKTGKFICGKCRLDHYGYLYKDSFILCIKNMTKTVTFYLPMKYWELFDILETRGTIQAELHDSVEAIEALLSEY